MKSKGIVIELTALLDVILIMLFWVMLNMDNEVNKVRAEAEQVKSDAADTIAEKQAEFDRRSEELQNELESVQSQYDRFLDENADVAAVANQKALDEFAEGRMLTLNLSYDAVGTLFIMDENGELAHTLMTSDKDITALITDVLADSGMNESDVILCAFVYDGDRALYRDVKTVSDAAEAVGKHYNNFYCTYINISR